MLVGKVDQDGHLIEGYSKYFLGKSLPPLNQNYFQHVILVESTDYEMQFFRCLNSFPPGSINSIVCCYIIYRRWFWISQHKATYNKFFLLGYSIGTTAVDEFWYWLPYLETKYDIDQYILLVWRKLIIAMTYEIINSNVLLYNGRVIEY